MSNEIKIDNRFWSKISSLWSCEVKQKRISLDGMELDIRNAPGPDAFLDDDDDDDDDI